MNIDNRNFTLPSNNVVMQVQDAEKAPRAYYGELMQQNSKNFDDFGQFTESHLSIFNNGYQNLPKDAQIMAITSKIYDAPLQDILPKIPESDRGKFLELRETWDKIDNATKSNPFSQKAYEFLNLMKDKYAKFIDNSRPHPSEVLDPHPNNVKVLAAASQNESAGPSPKKGESLSWSAGKFSNALATESSIDAAMDKTSKDAVVMYNPYTNTPDIQKPVTTKRENPTAWKKSDNDNPNVKRIAIFNTAEDGSGRFQNDADKISKNFYVDDPNNKSHPFENRFRVDKIINVESPTKEEAQQGITQADKTRQAFEQSKQFMEQQKDLARQKAIAEGKDPEEAVKALRFEGFAGWFGHGTTVTGKSPKKDDPRYYQEGSAEFKFLTKQQDEKEGIKEEGIEESEIKKMEQNVKDYSYFTQYFDSCHSGAMAN